MYVKQFIRFKYAAPAGQGASTVLTASLPGRLLEKCMAGEGLLAQMIVDKYLDHLPIHRQLQRFERMGVRIPQSTSNDWVKNTLSSLHSIYQAHKRITLATSYLSADETPIKVLDETMDGAGVCGTANLFSGNHEASERAAMIYSLLATCKLHDIVLYHWLKDVLETLHQFKANDIESLLPQNWKQLPQP